ncbi:Uncharacterized protein Adt_08597 [Abeliophyllum distichum]|uniref:Uncharacterized protein n=1 Tax=Abeliophyllum distichum TaxID=126358 RepID=A0ABD1UET0_9LAMI
MSSSSRIMFFFTILLMLISTAKPDGGGYGDGTSSPSTCTNCTICPYPCRSQPPPPPSGYQSYGSPPPTSPVAQVNCPPAAPVQCCQQYAPSTPFYYPYSNYSGSPHLQVIKPSTPWWIVVSSILFLVRQV